MGLVYGRVPTNEALHAMEERGAHMSVLIKPTGGFSLRSRKDVPVCHVVAQEFGGGGHPNASGGQLGLGAFGLAALWSRALKPRAAWNLAAYVLIPALIWVVSYASSSHLSQWIDLFHRGEAVGPASDYLRGKVPYRDVFVLHGLLEDGLLDAWLMQIFGRSLDVAIMRPVVLASLLAPLLWYLGLAIFQSIPLALLCVAACSSGAKRVGSQPSWRSGPNASRSVAPVTFAPTSEPAGRYNEPLLAPPRTPLGDAVLAAGSVEIRGVGFAGGHAGSQTHRPGERCRAEAGGLDSGIHTRSIGSSRIPVSRPLSHWSHQRRAS